MTRGDSDAVTAAVTLDRSLPRDEVLRRVGAAEEPGVVVSCRIEAQLTASDYEFEVSEEGWVERSLLTTDTARWTWYVTPKVGGNQTVVLHVRPIMKVRAAHPIADAASSNVQQYELSIDVKVPWTERPQETMSRLAATFKVAEGLVTTMTALVAAVMALGAVLGVRSRSKKRARAKEKPRRVLS